MAFSEVTVKQAWQRSGGKCECRREGHEHHYVRCNKELVWDNRGRNSGKGAWEAHHKTNVQSDGSDALSNCEILCWECHSKTLGSGNKVKSFNLKEVAQEQNIPAFQSSGWDEGGEGVLTYGGES